MPDDALKPALRAALREHEIGSGTPYKLYFAAKGKSGASFGFMQGDLAAGQAEVHATFRAALTAANIPTDAINSLEQRLSVPLIANPLGAAESAGVDAALRASSDRVDAMDEAILTTVYVSLDTCASRAHAGGRSIAPEALLAIALWINMSGAPTKLLVWLGGADPGLGVPVPPPGHTVDLAAMLLYLRATDYFRENPTNLQHLQHSIATGATLLPHTAADAAVAPALAETATPPLPDACFIYEQATGRLFVHENGKNDLLATGYSGSEQDGGKNNPSAQCEQDIGPIPRGVYTIGAPFNGPSPFSLRLTPLPQNDMCGRDGFLIHGDSIAAPGTASHGCIILDRASRESINAKHVGPLVVVARLG